MQRLIDFFSGIVGLGISLYLIMTGVDGWRNRNMRLGRLGTTQVVGTLARMLSSLFVISGAAGIVLTLWLMGYVVLVGERPRTSAVAIWTIGTCATSMIAYAFIVLDQLKAWRNTSTLRKLVLISVTLIGGVLGLAAWLWIRANP